MTVLRPVVQTLMREMPDRETKVASRCSIGFQLVSNQTTGAHPLPFEEPGQRTLGCFGVPTGLQDFVENIAVLIHGSPQPVSLATNHDPHFVQMPEITRPGLLATQEASVSCAKLQAPPTDRLI